MDTKLRRAAAACAAITSAVALAACGGTAGGGREESAAYPSERLSIMAPADPGGGWDETARAFQQAVREARLGEGAEVYNVPGAGGTLGLSRLVAKEQGDPHQLMVMGLVMLGAVETNGSTVGVDEATPVATLTEEAEAIVVPADSEFRSLRELLTALADDPTSVAWAGGSAGGTDQLLVGLLAKAAGVDPRRTKYVAHSGGGEAKTAILSGSVQAGVSGVSEFADQVEAGKMRALAVSGKTPLEIGGRRVPTIRDEGYDVVLTNWRGIVAPPGLSAAEREAVVRFVERVRATPAWKSSVERFGWTELALAGAEFDAFLRTERERVRALVSDLGLKS